MARKPQYAWPWPKKRLEILERDGYLCQIRGPRCTHKATQVDHIIPHGRGGARLDDDNLRAACAECNNQLSSKGRHPKVTRSRDW